MTKRRAINGPFAPRTIEMLRSPAMRALSLTGRRILDRLEIELATHGGRDNGKLPATHADFRRFGIDHDAIAAGIREVCALGFVKLTRRGFAGIAEHHCPSLFQITYRHTDGAEPTNAWRQIATAEEAAEIAAKARANKPKRHWSFTRKKKKFPIRENPESTPGNPDREPIRETRSTSPKTSRSGKPGILSRNLSIYQDCADGGGDPERQLGLGQRFELSWSEPRRPDARHRGRAQWTLSRKQLYTSKGKTCLRANGCTRLRRRRPVAMVVVRAAAISCAPPTCGTMVNSAVRSLRRTGWRSQPIQDKYLECAFCVQYLHRMRGTVPENTERQAQSGSLTQP